MYWAPVSAQTADHPGPVAKYTATVINLNPGTGESVTIDVLHWSSVEDRHRLTGAWSGAANPDVFETVLAALPTLGYIWTKGESIGYPLRYAQQLPLPGGGERILLVTDRRLGVWTRGQIWKPSTDQDAPDYPFTLVELHLTKRGNGEGKMSISSAITVEQDGKAIGLTNYDSTALTLKDVKTEHPGY
jgi:hypothetical protein